MEFNIDTLREGAEVETRSGEKVRVLCTDKKGTFPIVALITHTVNGTEYEECALYDAHGHFKSFNGNESEYLDLVFRQN